MLKPRCFLDIESNLVAKKGSGLGSQYLVWACTLIVFSPNTNPLTTTKYQGPQTCISSSDLYFKIRSLLSSLLIYRNFPAVWQS